MRLRAISTVYYGKPEKPGIVQPGEEFDPATCGISDDEASNLVARGHAAALADRTVMAAGVDSDA